MDFAYWSAAHWPLVPLPLTSTGSEHTKKRKSCAPFLFVHCWFLDAFAKVSCVLLDFRYHVVIASAIPWMTMVISMSHNSRSILWYKTSTCSPVAAYHMELGFQNRPWQLIDIHRRKSFF